MLPDPSAPLFMLSPLVPKYIVISIEIAQYQCYIDTHCFAAQLLFSQASTAVHLYFKRMPISFTELYLMGVPYLYCDFNIN